MKKKRGGQLEAGKISGGVRGIIVIAEGFGLGKKVALQPLTGWTG